MPIQAPQWTEYLSCPVCENAFDLCSRLPISISSCGHTVCKTCLSTLQRRQCPFDQVCRFCPLITHRVFEKMGQQKETIWYRGATVGPNRFQGPIWVKIKCRNLKILISYIQPNILLTNNQWKFFCIKYIFWLTNAAKLRLNLSYY